MKKFLPWPPQKNNSSGFSLLELTIVVTLIALIVSLSGAHIYFLNRMMVRAELEHLYNVCFYMQRRALMTMEPQQVFFDVQHRSYSANGHSYPLPAQVQFGTMSGVQGPPSSPQHLITEPVSFKNNCIVFHPDGVIKPGAVYLTDSNRKCTYALSCSVSAVSYLRKYQYTDKWHLFT